MLKVVEIGPRHTALGRTLQKTLRCLIMVQQFLCCGLLIHSCGAVSTESLSSNGHLLPSSCHDMHSYIKSEGNALRRDQVQGTSQE
jgi:hypothetical protein